MSEDEGARNRLVEDRFGIVNRITGGITRQSQGKAPVWPVTVITGDEGAGKTRIVQEVYQWLRTQADDGYWPVLDPGDLTARKLPGPPVQGLVWHGRTLPGFGWWSLPVFDNDAARSFDALRDQLLRHRTALQRAWLSGSNVPDKLVAKRDTLMGLLSEGITEGVTDNLIGALESMLGDIPLAGVWISWSVRALRWGKQAFDARRSFLTDIDTNIAVDKYLGDEIKDAAAYIASVTRLGMPGIVAVEDAHLLTSQTLALLDRLVSLGGDTAPIHLLCTAVPEKQAPGSVFYRWLHEQTKDGLVRIIALPEFTLHNTVTLIRDHAPGTTETAAVQLCADLPEPYSPLLIQSWLAGPQVTNLLHLSDALTPTDELLATIPSSIDEWLQERWARLSIPEQDALRMVLALTDDSASALVLEDIAIGAATAIRGHRTDDIRDALASVIRRGWLTVSDGCLGFPDRHLWRAVRDHATRGTTALGASEIRVLHARAKDLLTGWIDAALAEYRWTESNIQARCAADMWGVVTDTGAVTFQTEAERAVWVMRTLLPGRDDLTQHSIDTLLALGTAPLPASIAGITIRKRMAEQLAKHRAYAEAIRVATALLEDQLAVHGPDHRDTLDTRYNIAFWTGEGGDYAEALRLTTELLPDRTRVLGKDHSDTLTTRNNIAVWTGNAGNPTEALRLFTELLPNITRVLGPDHPDTLRTRHNIASWTGEAGDYTGALRLFTELLPDQARTLGPDHPYTLATRGNIASWTGEAGDYAGALRLFIELLPDRARVLGPDHPDTLITRSNIASWTGRTGDYSEALRLSIELLPDFTRILGPDHPDTLTIRSNIASWTGNTGNYAEALRLFIELLPDRARVLGPDHPDILRTRSNIASCTGETGNPTEALRLFTELLPDRTSVLGPDHPDTQATREAIAHWTERIATDDGNRAEP
ncbi:MAG TPA: tetratricopeptide repeat protein [Arachnia sp.]|nr:tetratricopeptide repeat protein [Arachnia sp.]HMT86899.1 tetratricopeptide repeat protein [Arachnia sp.]